MGRKKAKIVDIVAKTPNGEGRAGKMSDHLTPLEAGVEYFELVWRLKFVSLWSPQSYN